MFFEGELRPGREHVLPSGESQLLFDLGDGSLLDRSVDDPSSVVPTPGAAYAGVRGSWTTFDAGGSYALLIVNFKPGGASPFVSAPASDTAGQLIPLDELWGGCVARIRERLWEASTPTAKCDAIEAELRSRLEDTTLTDPAIPFSIAALDRGVRVASVIESLGGTSKSFVRSFTECVGLTPKRFARVRRLQRAVSSIPLEGVADWAELAVQCGYFDQAHMIHDFVALAGITPTQYRPTLPDWRNHVAA